MSEVVDARRQAKLGLKSNGLPVNPRRENLTTPHHRHDVMDDEEHSEDEDFGGSEGEGEDDMDNSEGEDYDEEEELEAEQEDEDYGPPSLPARVEQPRAEARTAAPERTAPRVPTAAAPRSRIVLGLHEKPSYPNGKRYPRVNQQYTVSSAPQTTSSTPYAAAPQQQMTSSAPQVTSSAPQQQQVYASAPQVTSSAPQQQQVYASAPQVTSSAPQQQQVYASAPQQQQVYASAPQQQQQVYASAPQVTSSAPQVTSSVQQTPVYASAPQVTSSVQQTPVYTSAPQVTSSVQQTPVYASAPQVTSSAPQQVYASAPQVTSSAPQQQQQQVYASAPQVTSSAQQQVAQAPAMVNVNERAPPTTTAQGHGQVTDRGDSYDYGVSLDESTTYSGFLDLSWNASGEDLMDGEKARFYLSKEDLAQIFRVIMKDPDRALTDPNAYRRQDVDLSQVMLKKFIVRTMSNNTNVPLDVVADPSALMFLNTWYKVGQHRHTMVSVPARAKSVLGGKDGLVIADHGNLVSSKTFLTFGHTNINKFQRDIIFPADDAQDQRLEILMGSQLAKLISDNREDLAGRFPQHNPILESGPKGHKCHMAVVLEALKQYDMYVKPLLRGIVDATRPVYFELTPSLESSLVDAVQGGSLSSYKTSEIRVNVGIEVEYCFPSSAYGRYRPVKASGPSVRQQFQEQFQKLSVNN